MSIGKQITAFCLFFIFFIGKSQHEDSLVVAFYNVENLFDTVHQYGKDDLEYLPNGLKSWNTEKYQKKLMNLSRVINYMNRWQGPDIIGLCEVENRAVLTDLLATKGLANKGYKIIHRDSPDKRGIDVCALYKPDRFNLIDYEYITVKIPESSRPTREILYVKGETQTGDTVHVFYNHWPSRYGGEAVSEPKRFFVAGLLRTKIDSLLKLNAASKIMVSGDFNDGPQNRSIQRLVSDSALIFVNTSNSYPGSHKYQAEWNAFDQLFVSKAVSSLTHHAEIVAPDWVTQPDDKFTGSKPFRTHSGPNYLGGYSDHFGLVFRLYK